MLHGVGRRKVFTRLAGPMLLLATASACSDPSATTDEVSAAARG